MKSLKNINRVSLDIGTKYTGICLYLNGIIIPQKRINNREINKILKQLINDYDIKEIIVGNPLDKYDKETKMSNWIKKFICNLTIPESIKIHFFNERYTSKEAERFIKDNIGKKNYKQKVDAISACFILKRFLNEN